MPHGIDIDMLILERQKLRKALWAMDELLRSLEVDVTSLDDESYGKVTLVMAIKSVVSEMRSSITKDAVIERLRVAFPQVKANPQSVASALVKMTQEEGNFLFLEKRGSGNQPSIYTTAPTLTLQLQATELELLFAPERTHGNGGWQSLFKRLQGRVDRASGEIILTEKLLHDIRHYFFNYGVGGWQTALKAIFGKAIPEQFRPLQVEWNEDRFFAPGADPNDP